MTTISARSLLDPDVIQSPYAYYDELRRDRPIAWLPEIKAFFVSRYDLAKLILTDPRFQKGSAEKDGRKFVAPNVAAQQILLRDAEIGLPVHCLSESNGPVHAAYRKILEGFLSRRSVLAKQPAIEEQARLLAEGIADGECDVVADYAAPFALGVISDAIGFPPEMRSEVKAYADAALIYLTRTVPEEEAIAGAETMVAMHGVVRALVAERRRAPQGDILTTLATATIEDRSLSDREICYIIEELVVGGNETTANAINGGLLFLAQNPELQNRLRQEPDRIPAFVEEILRFTPSIQAAHRIAREDIEIEGVMIPKASKVFLGTAAANRDGARFGCPAAFDQDREGLNQHIAFGGGQHLCIGIHMTRIEQAIAYRTWLARFASTELAQPVENIRYLNSFATRSPIAIRVTVRTR